MCVYIYIYIYIYIYLYTKSKAGDRRHTHVRGLVAQIPMECLGGRLLLDLDYQDGGPAVWKMRGKPGMRCPPLRSTHEHATEL